MLPVVFGVVLFVVFCLIVIMLLFAGFLFICLVRCLFVFSWYDCVAIAVYVHCCVLVCSVCLYCVCIYVIVCV